MLIEAVKLETASEVIAHAREVERKRRAMFAAPQCQAKQAKIAPEPKPQPEPEPPLHIKREIGQGADQLIVDLASRFGITAESLRSDIHNPDAIYGRKLAAGIMVRRFAMSVPAAAALINISEASAKAGLAFVEHMFERHAVPLDAPIDDILTLLVDTKPRHSIHEIIKEVCASFRVAKADVISQRRTKILIIPRHMAMALSKHLTGRSFPEIGRLFGGRDHTTVLYAVHKFEPVLAAVNLPDTAPVEAWVAETRAVMAQIALAKGKLR